MTNDLRPLDEAQGIFMWTKIFLLSIAALFIPLFVPRPLHPTHKVSFRTKHKSLLMNSIQDRPISSPEYTSSIFSQYLYTYMDPIVAMGNRVSHLSPEYYLPLANRDKVETLRARLPNQV